MSLNLGSILPKLKRPPLLLIGMLIGISNLLFEQVEAQTAKVRGAHEGMAPNEKTDDLGITVPIASVYFPARRYPATDEFPTGPAIGERLPEFKLPNQDGEMIDFHADRGESKAIVVFYRSVVW